MTANAPAFAGAHLHFFWFQLSFASHPKSVRLERRREAHKACMAEGCLVFARHERKGGRNKLKYPFASSEDERPIRRARPMCVSTTLDTNGEGECARYQWERITPASTYPNKCSAAWPTVPAPYQGGDGHTSPHFPTRDRHNRGFR